MERSGALNRTIELWRKTSIKNDYGEYSEEWNLNRHIRAYVHNYIGNKTLTNDEVFSVIRLRITVRNQSDINEMDRLLVFGKFYQIDFIRPDDTNRWLSLRCTRINE